MTKQIVFFINCDDETCQIQAGGKCRFHNGKDSYCELFKKHLEHIYDEDSAFPLSQRLPECLNGQIHDFDDHVCIGEPPF